MANTRDSNHKPSPDNALEADRPSTEIDEVGQQKLPQDHRSPAAPADDQLQGSIPPDDPSTDSNMDSAEMYDEGPANTADTPQNPIVSDKNTGPPETEDLEDLNA